MFLSDVDHRFGTTWYRGGGAQDRMFSNAVSKGHTCYLSREDTTGYQFGSYSDWFQASLHLNKVEHQLRNFFEMMKEGMI